jgi:methylenetetrahydrofolate reductase (NADPH)
MSTGNPGRIPGEVGGAFGGHLARLLARGEFAVTGEIVPPVGADLASVTEHAVALVGSVDAVNLTDNPTATAHMSPLAGVAAAAAAGLEPTVQLTVRDRNRLALTSDLLGAWALGARNVFCLSGDPLHVGDHPDATVVGDVTVNDVIALARRFREQGTTLAGVELADPPRFLVGVADVPLAEPYEPVKLESKLEAGADFVITQIVYDVAALEAWAETMRARGLFERAAVLLGVTPLRSAKQARFMDEKLPGVSVPPAMIEALEAAGPDAEEVGLELAIPMVAEFRRIAGIGGIHVMGMGHDRTTRALVERAGLLPRPAA